jgi:hypothetical protein
MEQKRDDTRIHANRKPCGRKVLKDVVHVGELVNTWARLTHSAGVETTADSCRYIYDCISRIVMALYRTSERDVILVTGSSAGSFSGRSTNLGFTPPRSTMREECRFQAGQKYPKTKGSEAQLIGKSTEESVD